MGQEDIRKKKAIGEVAKSAISPLDYLTLEGEILMLSSARAERLGGHPDSFVGKTIFEVEPHLAGKHRERIARALETGISQEAEDEFVGPNGSQWFLTSYQPVQGAGTHFTALQLVSIEITERKKMEQDIRKREAELRSIFNATGDAIIAADFAANIYVFNPAAERMFGYTKEEMIGRPFFGLMAEDWQNRHEQFWEAGLDPEYYHARLSQGIEVKGLRKDGTEFPMMISIALASNDDEPFIIAVIRDVTLEVEAREERERMEIRLQEAQKFESLSVLAGGIAHDFNNLLTGILGNADMARRRVPEGSPARPLLENIISASERAAELTRQMLAYSGRGHFVVKPVDLNDVVRGMVRLLETSISKQASLHLDLTNDLPAVEVDVVQVQQIVMNLIINASEAIVEKGGGAIRISTGEMQCSAEILEARCRGDTPKPGHYVFLEVADDGPGIPPETAARIFEPFFSTKFAGRGLGLSAVLGIVRGHRGGLMLDSEVGRGTSFRVLLPARDLQTERVAAADRQETSGWKGSGAILLVDDEERVLSTAAEMLRELGFKVITAVSGPDALAKLVPHRDEIRCVLLDLTMPGMSGREAFDALRRIQGDLRIVLTSGYSEEDVTGRLSGRTPAGFLQKPYDIATLRRLLGAVLGPA